MKVLKTHLPKVINELLCEPTVDDVLDHMQRDLREIGVEDFGVFRFTYEGLPLEKWLLGARVEKGKVARHVHKGELQASPVFRHCNEALEPFFWYDTPHEPYDDERFKRAREDGVPEALVVPVPGPKGRDWGGLVWQYHEQPLRTAQASLHHSGHLHCRLLSPERPRCSS